MKSLFAKINELIRQPAGEKSSNTIFWRGAFIGLLLLSLLIMTMTGSFYNTGIPVWIFASGTLIIGILAFWLFRIIGSLIHIGLSKTSTFAFASIFAAFMTLFFARFIRFGLPDLIFYPGALILVSACVFIFGSGYVLVKRTSSAKLLHYLAVSLSTVAIGFCLYFLMYEGNDIHKVNYAPARVSLLSEKGIDNPATKGPFSVLHFTYGSGTDQRRKVFGSDVKYKSNSVDASRILPEWKGSKAKWRERFWGFSIKQFPLNGRVWMPEGKKNCPIILVVHGNHGMEEYSDPGYSYLGELLASKGFITVSVDENFINATWSGDFRGKEMPVRGWLLLKHLEQWRIWTTDQSHELYQKADLANVILAGHSRGGEAAPIAAQFNRLPYFPDDANEKFDFNFGIKGIVAIAPTDKRYDRRISLNNINYLSIQGSYDSDEASFFGFRQYQRIKFTDSTFYFKAGLYIHGANHGQFNSIWGKYDSGAPFKWLLNTAPQISMEDQHEIAKVYFSAFAEIVLNNNLNYRTLFIDSQTGADWLPEILMLNTYKDSNTTDLITYEEDIDVTTGTTPGSRLSGNNLKIWREEILKFRDKDTQSNNAAVIGWAHDSTKVKATYRIDFAKAIPIDSIYALMISMAPGNPNELNKDTIKKDNKSDADSAINFLVQIEDSLGNTATIDIGKLKKPKPRLKVQFVKLKGLHNENYGDEWEPTIETFELPIDRFLAETPVRTLKSIIFDFSQSDKGVLILDEISLSKKINSVVKP